MLLYMLCIYIDIKCVGKRQGGEICLAAPPHEPYACCYMCVWILLEALEHHVLYVDRGGRCGGRGVVETRVWCVVSVLSPRFGEGLVGPEDVQIRRRACVRLRMHSSSCYPCLSVLGVGEAALDGGVGLEARVAEGAAPGRAERTVFGLRVDPARGEAGVAVGGVAEAAPTEVAPLAWDLAPLAVQHVWAGCEAQRRVPSRELRPFEGDCELIL